MLRLPETKNIKIPKNPKDVRIEFFDPAMRHDITAFQKYEDEGERQLLKVEKVSLKELENIEPVTFNDLSAKAVSPTILHLIKHGDIAEKYLSRSERDQAIITELVLREFSSEQIISLFRNRQTPISDKYLESGKYADKRYLYNIQKAKAYITASKIEVEKDDRSLPVPIKTWDMLRKYFDKSLMPWEKSSEYKKIEGQNYLIYRREMKGKDRQELQEYYIRKDLMNENDPVPFSEMKEAYLSSIIYAIDQKSFIIEFTLSDKFKLIKGKDVSICGTERKTRELAEKLLANMQFRSKTKKDKIEIENYQNLYSGVQIVKAGPTLPTKLRVTLNPTYLEAMNEEGEFEGLNIETGKICGQYTQLTLPLRLEKNSREKYRKASLQVLERWGSFTSSEPKVFLQRAKPF